MWQSRIRVLSLFMPKKLSRTLMVGIITVPVRELLAEADYGPVGLHCGSAVRRTVAVVARVIDRLMAGFGLRLVY
jgi:hypothetical protein